MHSPSISANSHGSARLLSLALGWALACAAAGARAQEPGRSPARSPVQAPDQAPATEDPATTAARKLYAADRWPAGALRAGFCLAGFELPGWKGGPTECLPPAPIARRYADAAGADRILIELFVADTVPKARDLLLGWLSLRNSPEPAPTAASLGLPVGDAGFVGVAGGQNRIEWVAFVRGNLAARVVCLDPRVDPHPELSGIAQALDAALLQSALLGKEPAQPEHPAVRRFRADRERCRAGETIGLDLQFTDPGARGKEQAIVNWIVGGPGQGQGYVERDALGNWQLHATGPGAMTLAVVVVGSMGTNTTASLRLTIDE